MTTDNDGAKRRAIQLLLDAYAKLKDPTREEDMIATVKLFHLIARVEGDQYAGRWIRRQVALLEREAG